MQSKIVVDRITEYMRLSTNDGKLGWDQFRGMISTLVPLDLEDKIMQFLRSAVPIEVLPEKVDSYKFGREDIYSLCKACFEPLFKVTNDEFF